jgi:hypothetical protein
VIGALVAKNGRLDMLMHPWSIGLARIYALQALEHEIRRAHANRHPQPPRPSRRLLRRALVSGLAAAGRLLAGMGERLAARPAAEAKPLGCG